MALAALLFATGAQTPLLALLAFRRPRNLAALVVSYAALLGIAAALGPFTDAPSRLGLLALAAAPAELAAPAIARLAGAPMDRTGAFVAGSLVLSVVVTLGLLGGAGPTLLGSLNFAVVALLCGVALGGFPRARDALLPAIRIAGNVALVALALLAVAGAVPALDVGRVALAAAMLAAGLVVSAVVTRVVGGDLIATALGAGGRDFAVAATIASVAAGPTAAAVPVAYGALFAVLWGMVIVGRRMRWWSEEKAAR